MCTRCGTSHRRRDPHVKLFEDPIREFIRSSWDAEGVVVRSETKMTIEVLGQGKAGARWDPQWKMANRIPMTSIQEGVPWRVRAVRQISEYSAAYARAESFFFFFHRRKTKKTWPGFPSSVLADVENIGLTVYLESRASRRWLSPGEPAGGDVTHGGFTCTVDPSGVSGRGVAYRVTEAMTSQSRRKKPSCVFPFFVISSATAASRTSRCQNNGWLEAYEGSDAREPPGRFGP